MFLPRLICLLLTVSLAMRQRHRRTNKKNATSTIRVMPMGDSITAGCGDGCDGNGCGTQCFGLSNPSCMNGWRGRVWNMLSPGSRNSNRWDFIGTLESGNDTVHPATMQAKHGFRIGDHFWSRRDWLPLKPDIIALHIGTNNLGFAMQSASYTLNLLHELLDTIVTELPDTKVLLSTIIGAYNYGAEKHAEYNDGIRRFAKEYKENGYTVDLVDMANEAGLGACELEFCCDHFLGRVHPNGAGYDRMAGVWYKALKAAEAKYFSG